MLWSNDEKGPRHVYGGDFLKVIHYAAFLQCSTDIISRDSALGSIFWRHFHVPELVGVFFGVRLFSVWGIPYINPVFFFPQRQHCQQPYLSAWLRYLQIVLDLHINMMQNNLLHPVSRDIFLTQTTSNKCIKAFLMQPLAIQVMPDRTAPLG